MKSSRTALEDPVVEKGIFELEKKFVNSGILKPMKKNSLACG